MGIYIAPKAHDIVFTFNDSCNCCTTSRCCKPDVEPKAVYINTGGGVESFKGRKAREDTSKAFERSLAHLNQTLDRKVIGFKGNPGEFQERSDHVLKSIYNTKQINVAHLEAINEIMLDYVAERSPSLEVREISSEVVKTGSCVIL